MNKFILCTLLSCVIVGLGDAASSNCKIGGCTCGQQNINVNKPGETPEYVDVCCPPSDGVQCSKYVYASNATATTGPTCTCDFTRVFGNCKRGEQCSTGQSLGRPHLNGMFLCCDQLTDEVTVSRLTINGLPHFYCNCAPHQPPEGVGWTGNCTRGPVCKSCLGKTDVGFLNGLLLCCPGCKNNPTVDFENKTCYC